MKFSRQHIATFIALLFHLCGAVGILFTSYKDWFIANTPLNLCLMSVLLAWNQQEKWTSFLVFFLIAFIAGMCTEIIGVNTGWLFGNYFYGEILGPKIRGVPLLIGLNWFVVVYCSGCIMRQMQEWMQKRFEAEGQPMPKRVNAISLVVDGALLAVLFDWIMEPVAMKLGFWQWQNSEIPLYNYVCWFVISLLLLFVARFFSFQRPNHFAVHLFIIQALFFMVLRTYLP
jgi:putative membrane protein